MKLNYPQLASHLIKNLAPIYIVSGDETLLVQEAVALIRSSAREKGYTERTSLSIDAGTDWEKIFHSEAHSLSLFATKRIIELQLAGTKPNANANKILQSLANKPLQDTLLIISTHKLDAKLSATNWYKALEKNGVAVQVWPITPDQLPAWISQRAKNLKLNIALDAAKLLAELVEGNLLAAAQEIEKLAMLQPAGTITIDTIEQAVTDNARFDIFTLVECAFSGNTKRSLRMLANLQAEDVEPILVLWALSREIRTLAEISYQVKQGVALSSLFTKFRVWEKRQPGMRRFLQQQTLPECWALLSHAAKIDRILKGITPGNVWDELQQLTLQITRGSPCPNYSNP
ncbi:MAG: DNA polymerase III subunit delta [Gammaproteobacteria bacterium]|nr:DNA polymerase III subunit delta [Gammaproteobacteria bacterium]